MGMQSNALTTTFRAPPLALLVTEPLRAALDYCAAKLGAGARPIGDGHPVIVFPGLGGAPFATSHLRRFLADSGFDARCWGRGINTGPDGLLDDWLGALVEDTLRVHAETGRKVSLVGWSLGGVYAREVAKLAPQAVRQVITLGTPFASMGGGATHAETIYKWLGGDTPNFADYSALAVFLWTASVARTPPLVEKYGFTEKEITFFRLHIVADTEHGKRGYDLVERLADTDAKKEACLRSVREATQMRRLYLDSLYNEFVAPRRAAAE